ncbi:MAG TPA: hypothetical protein PKG65_03880 [Ferruginibacter sp.]|jgi:hypothetical protein|nr:hypothetical protein [Ferruginibacter sp.]
MTIDEPRTYYSPECLNAVCRFIAVNKLYNGTIWLCNQYMIL